MTPAPPRDPALPWLPDLFAPEVLRRLVGRALDGPGAVVVACRPDYVRYKPGTSCILRCVVEVDEDGARRAVPAYVKSFASDQARARFASGSLARLLARAEALHGPSPVPRAALLPEARALLLVSPLDEAMHFMVRAASGAALAAALRKHAPGCATARVCRVPELVRYKPERRALFRYQLASGPAARLYGKVYAEPDVDRVARHIAQVAAGGVATPPVLVAIARRGFLGLAEAPGQSLLSMRGDPGGDGHLDGAIELLLRLQRVALDGAPVVPAGGIAAVAETTGRWLATLAPTLASRLARLHEQIAARLPAAERPLVACHGDFYEDQLLVEPRSRGLTLLDLDEARRSHPLLDAGNMLAHLRVASRRGELSADVHARFRDGARRGWGVDDGELGLFEAIGLLALAPGPFRRLEPAWPDRVAGIVALAEEVLAETRRAWAVGGAGCSRAAPPDPRDPALPQLGTLLCPVAMSTRLARELGIDGLRVDRVELVRHKPGRRAILRYELSSDAGDAVAYGKTFASGRGARVHEIASHIHAAQAFGAGTATPEPVAFLPELKLTLQRAVPGEPAVDRLRAGDVRLAERIATALRSFHASALDLGRTHTLEAELAPLAERVRQVAEQAPGLAGAARRCLARANAVPWTAMPWRAAPVHRDLYHDQLLVDGERLVVLDLDDAAMSEPAVDVANVAAHLTLLGIQEPARDAAVARARRRFVATCRELDPGIDPDLLRLLHGTTLIRLAGIHVGRPDGRRVAAALLAQAAELLEPGAIRRLV